MPGVCLIYGLDVGQNFLQMLAQTGISLSEEQRMERQEKGQRSPFKSPCGLVCEASSGGHAGPYLSCLPLLNPLSKCNSLLRLWGATMEGES